MVPASPTAQTSAAELPHSAWSVSVVCEGAMAQRDAPAIMWRMTPDSPTAHTSLEELPQIASSTTLDWLSTLDHCIAPASPVTVPCIVTPFCQPLRSLLSATYQRSVGPLPHRPCTAPMPSTFAHPAPA